MFIGQSVYVTLPAIAANMAPVIFKNVPVLNCPLDFGIKIGSMPLIGPRKTFRGLISGIVVSMIIVYIQYFIYKWSGLKNLSLLDYGHINIHLFGFFVGFGVMFGDIAESFIKRRLNILPSTPFVPWDQIDCVLGGLVFTRIVWAYSLKYAVTIIVLTFLIHVTIRHIAYYLRINESKW